MASCRAVVEEILERGDRVYGLTTGVGARRDALDVALALDFEAFAANVSVLHPAIAEARPYPGLAAVLERVRGLLEGSYLWADGAARMLQDPLSFRSAVQVHGAARDALAFARGQLEIELNAAQENPLLVSDER